MQRNDLKRFGLQQAMMHQTARMARSDQKTGVLKTASSRPPCNGMAPARRKRTMRRMNLSTILVVYGFWLFAIVFFFEKYVILGKEK